MSTPSGVPATRWQTLIRGMQVMPLQISERRVLLFIVDLLLVNAALLILGAWRLHQPLGWQAVVERPEWYLLLSGLWLACALLLGLYQLERSSRLATIMPAALLALAVSDGAYLAVPYISPPLPASRLTTVLFLLLTAGPVLLWRAAYATFLVRPALRQRAVIVGAGHAGQVIADLLINHAAGEYDVVCFVDDDVENAGQAGNRPPVRPGLDRLGSIVEETRASQVVVARPLGDPGSLLCQGLLDCQERGVQVVLMPALYERLTGRLFVERGADLPLVVSMDTARGLLSEAFKRGFDLMIGAAGLVVLALLLPVVALVQRVQGPGPVFYRQRRVGRGGKPFTLLKFRTMTVDAEAGGPRWAEEGDSRVIWAGRLMRRLHLDEVPQAINLLTGEMSFVGPRPERPELVAELERQISFYRLRHSVRPGVTGWAQVNYRYGSSVHDALIKLQYDLYYVKHQSMLLDLLIILKTLWLVLTLRGR